MKFSFVTLFPGLIDFYFKDSILKIALEKNFFEYDFFNPRDYTKNKHRKVDSTLCGGGAGQLLNVQPLFDCLDNIRQKNKNSYIIFPLAAAKKFTQKDAIRLSKKKHIVIVSGRYEGIDERVIEKYANEVFCIGEYILTGGELPSLVMVDSIVRNIDEVLGNNKSLEEESYTNNDKNIKENAILEAPSFSKPLNFRTFTVPSELVKGNHSIIRKLKNNMSVCKTKYYRP